MRKSRCNCKYEEVGPTLNTKIVITEMCQDCRSYVKDAFEQLLAKWGKRKRGK